MVALLAIIIAGAGLFSMFSLKQELIPSISIPITSVVTTSPGASPDVVDEQISKPLSVALKNVSGVESVTSTSSSSISSITVSSEFGLDSAVLKADIAAAVDSVTDQLPEGAEPQVVSGSLADLPVISLTASSDADINTLGERLAAGTVPDLEGIAGVREVTLSGVASQNLTITPVAASLAAAGLTVQDITAALDANGITLPVGSITDNGVTVPVQGGTAVSTVADVQGLPLASATVPGVITTIGAVASVEVVAEAATSITRTNGAESLSLSITALPDADLVSISHAVGDMLGSLEDDLGDSASLVVVFDQAPFIEQSIEHLAVEGLLGLVFAVIIILVFLFSVRSTLVTAVSIPLSVLVTFIGLNIGGFSLNMLTLGALTIAIGRVVDDSIVVIENIKRHLSYGKDKKQAILTGVREVAGAITASTLTTVMVFLPIALVGGVVGELFRPFAVTVAIAMVSSLLVALTIVPVMAFWFLKTPRGSVDAELVQAEAEGKEARSRLQRAYVPILRGTQKRPVVTVVASVLLLVLTAALIPLLKVDFLGASGQNTLSVTQSFASGTELATISDVTAETETAILDTDGVETVQLTAGSSGGASAFLGGGGGGDATFQITTDSDADQTALQADLTERLAALPAGADITVAASAAAFGSSTVDVIVTANDDEVALAAAAEQVSAALTDVPLSESVTSDRTADQPTVQITVNREAALRAGFTELQLTGLVASQLTPSSVGSIRIDGSDLDIFVETGSSPQTLDELRQLQLPSLAGVVTLADLATVEIASVPTTITREGGELIATISLTPEEGELGAVSASVQERLDELDLPAGVTVSLGGATSQQTEAFSQLGLAMVVAIAIVYLLMVATFRSLIQPLILLVSIPFAATGAIGLLLVTGRPLGVASLIGLLMLIGIVVTNAIVLIDLVNQYRRQGQNVADAVTNGARQRLRPILMTALATIFALTPMALGVTGSSGFISQDLAIVVIGGLVSSTALTLILVPVLYRLIEGRAERRAARKAHTPGHLSTTR
ncbi:MAG: efflux transporter permease subunit [Glaciihabitans sp.]|nr:efflux transporter permease subunit [Glaciihabitans sp.]